jgi:hypothetical protein
VPDRRKAKLKPPRELQGVPLADLYAQQKAEEDLSNLLKSDRPVDTVAAVAKGMAAGAAAPFVFQMLDPMAQVGTKLEEYAQKVRIANYLESDEAHETIRVPKGSGADRAEGVWRVLHASGQGPSASDQRLVMNWLVHEGEFRGDEGEYHPAGWKVEGVQKVFGSKREATQAFYDSGSPEARAFLHDIVASDMPEDRKARLLDNLVDQKVREVDANVPYVGAKPHPIIPMGLQAKADVWYQKAGLPEPEVMKPLVDHLRTSSKRALPAAAAFSIIGGGTALWAHLAKRKDLKRLVNNYKGVEKVSQVIDPQMMAMIPAAPAAVAGAPLVPPEPPPPPPDPRVEELKKRTVPEVKDVRTAPVVIQKQAAASGAVLMQCMFDELETFGQHSPSWLWGAKQSVV